MINSFKYVEYVKMINSFKYMKIWKTVVPKCRILQSIVKHVLNVEYMFFNYYDRLSGHLKSLSYISS